MKFPSAKEVRDYRDANGISLAQARRHLIRQAMFVAIQKAASWEEAQPALLHLIKVVGINS